MVRERWVRTGRAATLLSALGLLLWLWAARAAAFPTAPYFPLDDDSTWTYSVSDGTTETRTVIGSKTFNGLSVKVVRDQAGNESYFTNDGSGIRFHGGFFPDPVNGNETDTYSPPVVFAAADGTIGTTVNSSGTVSVFIVGLGTFNLSHSSSSTLVAVEAVTVPAGSFPNAIHVQQRTDYSGAASFYRTTDAWLVAGVGSVREVSFDSSDNSTTTWTLTSYSVPDRFPDAFSFPSKTVNNPFVLVTSDPITVTGINVPSVISISGGGSYRVNGGVFTSSQGTVVQGDTVQVQLASPNPGFSTSTTLNIGGQTANFIVTTLADTLPDPFSFTPAVGVPPGVVITSNLIAPTGLNAPAPVSVAGGEYAFPGQPFTSAPGTLCPGCSVKVRVQAPPQNGSQSTVTLTIGGVSGTFTVTTLTPDQGPSTLLYFVSQPGDLLAGGITRLINFGSAYPGSQIQVTRNPSGGISLAMFETGGSSNLDLDAPGSGPLLPGRYEGAVRYPFNGTAPGLDLNMNGSGCNSVTGRFDVLDVGYAADGTVARLAVNFEQHCEGLTPALFGQMRLNSAVPLNSNAIRRSRADLSGDSHSDVLWRNVATGENYLYPMNSTAILGSEGYIRTVADLNWKIVGVGDFDGDGRADLLWRNTATGQNYIYLMNGTTIVSEGYIRTVADQNWQVAGTGDFDGDGKDDILWRNSSTGENYLYPMDGLAIKAGEGSLRTVADANWKIVGVGDFDGDGKSDILWRNTATGENYIYLMDGRTIRSGEGYIRAVADTVWQVKGIGDLDGDGKADIVWRNATTGENYLYPMDGTTIKTSEGYFRTVPDQAWQIVALGDYDADGKCDLLWRNSSTGENYIYLMDGRTIKPGEGYFRAVPDQNWQVQP